MVFCTTHKTFGFVYVFMIAIWMAFIYAVHFYKYMPTNHLSMVNHNFSSLLNISASRSIDSVLELNATYMARRIWNGVPKLVNSKRRVLKVAIPSKMFTPLPLCYKTPPHLHGPIPVVMEALPWEELNKLYPDVEEGGRWRPKHCKSRHHMEIVIPYRDRDAHLRVCLRHMHKVWRKQELDYGVYVIEQDATSLFNRGMLMNIGFTEALKVDNYTCFIFSDVDLLPENDRNIYGCPEQPRHLSVSIDTHGYTLMYPTYFGGVESFRTEHYRLINGFSNKYFGWGAEDDDLYQRLTYLETAHSRVDWDGLNSLQYKVVKYEKHSLYTLISVIIDQKAILKAGPPRDSLQRRTRQTHSLYYQRSWGAFLEAIARERAIADPSLH